MRRGSLQETSTLALAPSRLRAQERPECGLLLHLKLGTTTLYLLLSRAPKMMLLPAKRYISGEICRSLSAYVYSQGLPRCLYNCFPSALTDHNLLEAPSGTPSVSRGRNLSSGCSYFSTIVSTAA